jgi:hypothetical protein
LEVVETLLPSTFLPTFRILSYCNKYYWALFAAAYSGDDRLSFPLTPPRKRGKTKEMERFFAKEAAAALDGHVDFARIISMQEDNSKKLLLLSAVLYWTSSTLLPQLHSRFQLAQISVPSKEGCNNFHTSLKALLTKTENTLLHCCFDPG